MKIPTSAALLAAVLLASCSTASTGAGPAVVQPGAPGEDTRSVGAAGAPDRGPARHDEADVRFMQGMIAHHQQALEMTRLVPDRTERQDIHLLARRIALSQDDEIAAMRQWLSSRGADVPGEHAHHDVPAGGAAMAGMLTREELVRLEQARGAEFDRLFLELMIRHHEGAVGMVDRLFATPGAGQESSVFQLASHVASDQRVEIARMRRMLAAGR